MTFDDVITYEDGDVEDDDGETQTSFHRSAHLVYRLHAERTKTCTFSSSKQIEQTSHTRSRSIWDDEI